MVDAVAKRKKANPVLQYVNKEYQGPAGSGSRYDPNKGEIEFLRLLAERYDPGGKPMAHFSHHQHWYECVSFFNGLQWVRWDASLNKWMPRKFPPWKRVHTANFINPMVMRAISKLQAQQVHLGAEPASAEYEDLNAAKLAPHILDHTKRVSKFEKVRDDVLLWAAVTGTAFTKTTWNPNGGKVMTVADENGKTTDIQTGEIENHLATPFQVRRPDFCIEIDDCPWFVQETLKPIEWLVENAPDKVDVIAGNMGGQTDQYLERRLQAQIGPDKGIVNENAEDEGLTIRVIEFFTRPFKGYPQGIYGACTSDGIVLWWKDKNPYYEIDPAMAIPFTRYRWCPSPGRFWGVGLVEQLMPVQRSYNIARSQVMESVDLMTRPKWLSPKGHNLPKTAINSMPGEVIEYNPQLPAPQMAPIPGLPSYVSENIDRFKLEAQDIGAQQDVTQAKAPSGVRSGIAISLLQEADNAVLAVPKKELNKGDVRVGEFMLKLAQAKYEEPRTIAIVGKDTHEIEVMDFHGADLRGATTLHVTREDDLYRSRATQREEVMDWVQMGILDPANPAEKIDILRALEAGDVDGMIAERALDMRNADLENEMFMKMHEEGSGETSDFHPARDWEDHAVHVRRHNFFRKSARFMRLDREAQDRFTMHVQTHEMFLAEQMQQQMAMSESKKGAPGEKGQPSQPNDGGSPPPKNNKEQEPSE